MKKPVVGISIGDPAGIGCEVTVKALSERGIYNICRPLVIGDASLLEYSFLSFAAKHSLKVNPVGSVEDAQFSFNTIDVLNVGSFDVNELVPGEVSPRCGEAALEYVIKGIELALSRQINAFVTAPVCKESVALSGVPFTGHTEFLAEKTKTEKFAMMLASDKLRVIPVTRHIPLKEVPFLISQESILDVVLLGSEVLVKLGIDSPLICVSSLNPHAGEGGLLGKEEKDIIAPAIEQARMHDINVTGPLPADEAVHDTADGKYDMAVVMYHDQALIGVKLVSYRRSVNVTLGLPFVRTSPCHGTAFNIAGKGIADEASMLEAIRFAAKLCTCREVKG